MTLCFSVSFPRNHSATEYYTDRLENIDSIVMRCEITFFLICFCNVMCPSVGLNDIKGRNE